jgi:hypothetical protein
LGSIPSNPYWDGSPFKLDGINNPFSPYGSPFSNQSATETPRLFAGLSGLSGSFGLFGSFGFFGCPIRQPNERDKPNKPNKRNEPVWTLPTAAASELKDADPAAESLSLNSDFTYRCNIFLHGIERAFIYVLRAPNCQMSRLHHSSLMRRLMLLNLPQLL